MSHQDSFIVALSLEVFIPELPEEIEKAHRIKPELVERPSPTRKKYNKFRGIFEYLLKGSPHISPR